MCSLRKYNNEDMRMTEEDLSSEEGDSLNAYLNYLVQTQAKIKVAAVCQNMTVLQVVAPFPDLFLHKRKFGCVLRVVNWVVG